MRPVAQLYVAVVLLAGLSISLAGLYQPLSPAAGPTFLVMLVLATATQLLEAEAPDHLSYYPHLVVFFASLFLLPPSLFVLVVVIPHLLEWAKKRWENSSFLRAWYIQPFNMASHILAGAAALYLYEAIAGPDEASFATLLAVLGAAAAYTGMNHLLVGGAIVLGRGVSWHESEVWTAENLLMDMLLLLMGYTTAVVWQHSPWFLLPAMAPLLLLYRALLIPQLKRAAEVDSKTGLLNAKTWMTRFQSELARAERHGRPLVLLMADLDYLRVINNTYGHLAGDAVLIGVSHIIRQHAPANAAAGRFGGEEFAILLPDLNGVQAQGIAEEIRRTVAATPFSVDSQPDPLQATVSIGLAVYPSDGTSASHLIHEADIAVYQAKLQGRNRVVCRSEVPHSASIGTLMPNVEARVEAATLPLVARPELSPADEPTPPLSDLVDDLDDQVNDHSPPAAAPDAAAPPRTWAFVVAVISAAIGIMIFAGLDGQPVDWFTILLFAVLAVFAERWQWSLYEESSVSVSMVFLFAAALVGNVIGAAVVSAAVALTAASVNRPPLYKIGFNWGLHVLASLVPATMMILIGVPLTIAALPNLIVPSIMAALAYCLVETGLLATAIALSESTSPSQLWRSQFQWLVKHYLVLGLLGLFLAAAQVGHGIWGSLIFLMPIGLMRYTMKEYVNRTERGIRELRRLNRELNRANEEIQVAGTAIQHLNDELFMALALVIDARDPFAAGHGAKVADYAVAIAEELGWPEARTATLRQAAYLHDIGKLAIPESILQKPGRLTPEEYAFVKTHAAGGGSFLETLPALAHLAPFVRHHHERWDGKGYPAGLREDEIPHEARILALCDAVEAMASDRPYQRGKTPAAVLAEVRRCAGTQFDPEVVAAFFRVVEERGEEFIINSAETVTAQRQQTYEAAAVWLGLFEASLAN